MLASFFIHLYEKWCDACADRQETTAAPPPVHKTTLLPTRAEWRSLYNLGQFRGNRFLSPETGAIEINTYRCGRVYGSLSLIDYGSGDQRPTNGGVVKILDERRLRVP